MAKSVLGAPDPYKDYIEIDMRLVHLETGHFGKKIDTLLGIAIHQRNSHRQSAFPVLDAVSLKSAKIWWIESCDFETFLISRF